MKYICTFIVLFVFAISVEAILFFFGPSYLCLLSASDKSIPKIEACLSGWNVEFKIFDKNLWLLKPNDLSEEDIKNMAYPKAIAKRLAAKGLYPDTYYPWHDFSIETRPNYDQMSETYRALINRNRIGYKIAYHLMRELEYVVWASAGISDKTSSIILETVTGEPLTDKENEFISGIIIKMSEDVLTDTHVFVEKYKASNN